MSAGVQRELADALAGWPIGSGYYSTTIGTDEARELAEYLMPVIADAEKRAAAAALRELADDPAASTVTHTANFGLPARVVPVATIYRRAAALDPAGAASGETT